MFFRDKKKRDCTELIKNTVLNSLVVLQRSASVKATKDKTHPNPKKWVSVPHLATQSKCNSCSILLVTHCRKCVLCDGDLEMMNVAQSPCKNCASLGLTPVEQPLYRNYDILNCDRPVRICNCQKSKSSFVSLSNIRSYNCSVAQQNNCDPLTVDGEIPKNIRTTASGINQSKNKGVVSNSSNNYSWKIKAAMPSATWTCKRCTLLNGSDVIVCEACEYPYSSDFNSNVTPSVFIKVCSYCINSILY